VSNCPGRLAGFGVVVWSTPCKGGNAPAVITSALLWLSWTAVTVCLQHGVRLQRRVHHGRRWLCLACDSLSSAPHYPSRLRLVSTCRYDPDLVVSVHPLMQHIPARVLAARAKRLGRAAPVPLATVVTDFTTCHNTWFYRKVNKCFVPTEFCRWVAGSRLLW
jgi:hypothetical protein